MSLRRLVPALVVVCAVMAPALPVRGQQSDLPAPTLTVRLQTATLPDLPDNIAARLTDASGDPISGAQIRFAVQVDILGTRNAVLGTAETDATGVALMPLTPRRAEYTVKATFEGSEVAAPAETVMPITFPDDKVQQIEIVAPPSALGSLETVMPRAMGIVVALLWVFFAGAVVYVVRTLHRAPEPTNASGQ